MLSNNPIRFVDPFGDDDYFSLDGNFLYRDDKKTDYVHVVLQGGKTYNLTALKIPFKDKQGDISQTALLKIVSHYSVKNDAKFVSEGVDVMSYSSQKKKIGVYVKKNFKEDVYRLNPMLNTASNIKNAFEHEDQHADDDANNLPYKMLQSEMKAVMKQINTPSFAETTEDFKECIVDQYGGFFLTSFGEKYRKEFEEKTGYVINQTSKTSFTYERKEKEKK